MRWFASMGAVLFAGVLAGGDVASVAAPGPQSEAPRQLAERDNAATVDVELILAVDVSYSMDMDELAVQREGYAQAIASKEFLQALRAGPTADTPANPGCRRVDQRAATSRHHAISPGLLPRRCDSSDFSWSSPVLPLAVIAYLSFSTGACGFSIFMLTRPKSMLAL